MTINGERPARLSGQKAVVTGANRCIGRAIALAYATEGADVVISYRRDEAGAAETVRAIQALGRRAKAIYADFSDVQNIDSFFIEARQFLGSVDILVNNAAGYRTEPLLDIDVDILEDMFRVGVIAPTRLIQLAAKDMMQRGSAGSIVNISAILGEKPYPHKAAVSIVKAALNMLTKSSALELAPHHIRVNAIAPGSTPYDETSIYESSYKAQIPLQRAGTANDHAAAAVYLAMEEAAWVTGQILTIDGGQSLSFFKSSEFDLCGAVSQTIPTSQNS